MVRPRSFQCGSVLSILSVRSVGYVLSVNSVSLREMDFTLWFCVVVWFVWRHFFVMLSGALSFFAVLVWLVLHGSRPHHERSIRTAKLSLVEQG
jgi:hypothetical protein